nr:MAG TPA: hypothetical protein [Caudoviricetes sp.]
MNSNAGILTGPGRLKIKVKVGRRTPEPLGNASWEVSSRRWLVVEVHLGYVNAKGRDEALATALLKWPHERRLTVNPH